MFNCRRAWDASTHIGLMILACCPLLGCGLFGAEVIPDPIVPTPTTKAPEYTSSLSAGAFGHASVAGTVTNSNYSTAKDSHVADEAIDLPGGATGNENKQSCQGTTATEANSDAQFTPQTDPTRHAYGFSLEAKAFARGGYMRNHGWPQCTGSNNTGAAATTDVEGRLDFTFTPINETVDRLIIRANGDAPSKLQFLDATGTALPQKQLASGNVVVTDLVQPGSYSLVVGLHSAANPPSGGCAGCFARSDQHLTLSVQSMRDALILGHVVPGQNVSTISVPVVVTYDVLIDQLKKRYFTEEGKFFPCHQPSFKCEGEGVDIYLESPSIEAAGSALAVKAHISGHYRKWIFNPGVTGDVLVYATPVVANDVLSMSGARLDVRSNDKLIEIGNQLLSDSISGAIGKFTVDLKPIEKSTIDGLQSHFPIQTNGVCFALHPTDLNLVRVTVEPKDIEAFANVGISTDSGTVCSGPTIAAP